MSENIGFINNLIEGLFDSLAEFLLEHYEIEKTEYRGHSTNQQNVRCLEFLLSDNAINYRNIDLFRIELKFYNSELAGSDALMVTGAFYANDGTVFDEMEVLSSDTDAVSSAIQNFILSVQDSYQDIMRCYLRCGCNLNWLS